jgi:hypothetical protein
LSVSNNQVVLIDKETETSFRDPLLVTSLKAPGPYASHRHAIAQRPWSWCARHGEAVEGAASSFLPQDGKHSLPRSPVDASLCYLLNPLIPQRISDELSGCFEAGDGAPEPTALVVSPFGKVWRVAVGRDGDGAFLGRGWADFLAAHGIGLGFFVVLRHEGGGTLTVKVFDTSLCIKGFSAPAAGEHFISTQIWMMRIY